MPLFKTASEVFDQANDYLLRGDFTNALNKHSDAVRRFQKAGEQNRVLPAVAISFFRTPFFPADDRATARVRCSLGRPSPCSRRGCRSSGTAP